MRLKSSPWGQVDFEKEIVPDKMYFVCTPGHGGYMIRQSYATYKMSYSAANRGIRHGDWLCFEEDSDYAIPEWEMPELWLTIYPDRTEEQTKDVLWLLLSSYNPDYLLEKGVTPEATAYANHLDHEMHEWAIRKKHPDMVVSAWGSRNKDVADGTTRVVTADGLEYVVDSTSYDNRSYPPRLSLLEVIERNARVL